jgi:hypothetical protein
MQFVGSFFSKAFLFFRKKETKKLVYFKLIQDESASGTIFTSLSAIFFDPDAHPHAHVKDPPTASFKSFVGLTANSFISPIKE